MSEAQGNKKTHDRGLTMAQRWKVAEALARDHLGPINEKLDDVVPSDTLYARYGKRAVDVCVSSVALVIALPINMVLACATFLDVGSPIIFKQKRTGKDGIPFTLYKFRNMTNECDEHGELLPAEERVTKWGRFVRRTSLDELLNFWSILVGNMSVIGPRPMPEEYFDRYNKRHRARVLLRPGLECPPRDLSHVWTWQEQLDNDVWYVENVSFKTDLLMFVNLLRFAFDRKSADARGAAKRGIFMGYDKQGTAITLEDVPQDYIAAVLSEADL